MQHMALLHYYYINLLHGILNKKMQCAVRSNYFVAKPAMLGTRGDRTSSEVH